MLFIYNELVCLVRVLSEFRFGVCGIKFSVC